MNGPYRSPAVPEPVDVSPALRPMRLADLDNLIFEHRRLTAAYPDGFVMTPAAWEAYRARAREIGGAPLRAYMGIPIIVSGTPDDTALVGVIGRKTLHGEPVRVAAFASEGG